MPAHLHDRIFMVRRFAILDVFYFVMPPHGGGTRVHTRMRMVLDTANEKVYLVSAAVHHARQSRCQAHGGALKTAAPMCFSI